MPVSLIWKSLWIAMDPTMIFYSQFHFAQIGTLVLYVSDDISPFSSCVFKLYWSECNQISWLRTRYSISVLWNITESFCRVVGSRNLFTPWHLAHHMQVFFIKSRIDSPSSLGLLASAWYISCWSHVCPVTEGVMSHHIFWQLSLGNLYGSNFNVRACHCQQMHHAARPNFYSWAFFVRGVRDRIADLTSVLSQKE